MELIIPFSDANDAIECASLFAKAKEKGNVKAILPIYYPLYIIESKYGHLVIDPDLNFNIKIRYPRISLSEIEGMSKKIEESVCEDEFIQEAEKNNMKLKEICEKREYEYKQIQGILPKINLTLINTEINGIKLPVKYDFESLKKEILNKFVDIEKTLENALIKIEIYFNILDHKADLWKKTLIKKIMEIEKRYTARIFRMENHYNEMIRQMNEKIKVYQERMNKLKDEFMVELKQLENTYSIKLKDYEKQLELLNNLLNNLSEKRNQKVSQFDNLVERLRELYFKLLEEKIHELTKIRTHFLDDLTVEEKRLRDLANVEISKLKEESELLEEEIKKLDLYYENKLREKRQEIEIKEKNLQKELYEKITEVESKYRYLLDFLNLKEQLINISKKYQNLEKTLGFSLKGPNLDGWVYEKEIIKKQIDSEKEMIKQRYEKAIKELHNELVILERERDERISSIRRRVEELCNKMSEIAVRTDKQILEIQGNYSKNVLNVDVSIEEIRKIIEKIEKKKLTHETLKELPSFGKLIEPLNEISKEIEELQKQIDENNKKLDALRGEMVIVQSKLKEEKDILYTKYERWQMEYQRAIKEAEETIDKMRKDKTSEINDIQREMQNKISELESKKNTIMSILNEAHNAQIKLRDMIKIDSDQIPAISLKIPQGAVYVKFYAVIYEDGSIDIVSPFHKYRGRNPKKPLFKSNFFYYPFDEILRVIPEKIVQNIVEKLACVISSIDSKNMLWDTEFIRTGLMELESQGWIGRSRIKILMKYLSDLHQI